MATELVPIYQAAVWPTELQAPADILSTSLSADAREKLAVTETPFCLLGAERFYFNDGSPAVRFEAIIAPDDTHETPWKTSILLGLPKDKAEDAMLSDRERLLEYFEHHSDGRPVGPLIAVNVPTNYPQPYWAMRTAPDRVMARFALALPSPSGPDATKKAR